MNTKRKQLKPPGKGWPVFSFDHFLFLTRQIPNFTLRQQMYTSLTFNLRNTISEDRHLVKSFQEISYKGPASKNSTEMAELRNGSEKIVGKRPPAA